MSEASSPSDGFVFDVRPFPSFIKLPFDLNMFSTVRRSPHAVKLWFTGLTLFLLSSMPVQAENRQDTGSELKQVQNRIEGEKQKIGKYQKEEASLLDEMDQMDRLLRARNDDIRRLESESSSLKQRLTDNNMEGQTLEKDIVILRQQLRKRLIRLYRYYRNAEIAALVSADDYQSFIQQARLLGYLTHSDTLLIEQYKARQSRLTSIREELVSLNRSIESSRLELAEARKSLEQERRKREALLQKTRTSKHLTQQLIQDLDKAARNLRELLESSASRPEPVISSGAPFSSLKGRLPWPASGTVVSRFGRQTDPQFDTPVFRNGIAIRTTVNEPVRAVHEGSVAFAEWFKGYGQLIIIQHSEGYHTLYANLSEIYVRKGDPVTPRQMIARAVESGKNTPSGLYFEIRLKGTPQDPLPWLSTSPDTPGSGKR